MWWLCRIPVAATSTLWWICASFWLQKPPIFSSASSSPKSGLDSSAQSQSHPLRYASPPYPIAYLPRWVVGKIFRAFWKPWIRRWRCTLRSSWTGFSCRWKPSWLILIYIGLSAWGTEGIFRWPHFILCRRWCSQCCIILNCSCRTSISRLICQVSQNLEGWKSEKMEKLEGEKNFNFNLFIYFYFFG